MRTHVFRRAVKTAKRCKIKETDCTIRLNGSERLTRTPQKQETSIKKCKTKKFIVYNNNNEENLEKIGKEDKVQLKARTEVRKYRTEIRTLRPNKNNDNCSQKKSTNVLNTVIYNDVTTKESNENYDTKLTQKITF